MGDISNKDKWLISLLSGLMFIVTILGMFLLLDSIKPDLSFYSKIILSAIVFTFFVRLTMNWKTF